MSPNGQNLYVVDEAIGEVSKFSIGAAGALSPATGAPTISTGTDVPKPDWLAVTPDLGPTAAFTATVGPPGSSTTFSASRSTPGSASIATDSWNFGDGSTGSGASTSHIYAQPGKYTVTLTLTDSDLCSTSGPFTGQTAYCTTDPAATISQQITVSTGGTLTVSLSGKGKGTVTGSSIACPGSCSHSYPAGTHVTLTAKPAGGSRFSGWSVPARGPGRVM